MKFVRSLCTVALSAASASAFAGPAVASRSAVVSRSSAFVPAAAVQVVRPMSTSAAAASYSQLHMSAAADFINSAVADNKIVVFSKSYCPFCKKTKELFEDLGVEATVFELNQMDDGADIQDALLEITGQKTVPNTFINGKHVGGNDDVQNANTSGELKELLAV